jgi:hypothetical protein
MAPHGLAVDVRRDGDDVFASATPGRAFGGAPGRAHGVGIVRVAECHERPGVDDDGHSPNPSSNSSSGTSAIELPSRSRPSASRRVAAVAGGPLDRVGCAAGGGSRLRLPAQMRALRRLVRYT